MLDSRKSPGESANDLRLAAPLLMNNVINSLHQREALANCSMIEAADAHTISEIPPN
jgi:hypothetical protein